MDDIGVISGNIDYNSILILPSTLDRIDAVNYHCESVESYCYRKDFRKAKWHFRGALSEFKSIFDVVRLDIKNIEMKNIWNKDNHFFRNIANSTLINILKKTRNFAVHTAHMNGEIGKFNFVSIDINGEKRMSEDSIFINPIDQNSSYELNKIVTNEEIEWFNRQIKFWPAHLIIKEAVFLAYVEFKNFLSVNNKISPGQIMDL